MITVFSYGSNMCRARLQRRVGPCKWLQPAWLPGHQFRFHKRGKDQSAKADAFHTGNSDDRVWGALAILDAKGKQLLDGFEGLGAGYREKTIEATLIDRTRTQAQVYVAMDEHIDPGLKPFQWYQRFVLAGANEHSLPQAYIQLIQSHPWIADPDQERERYNQRIVNAPTEKQPRDGRVSTKLVSPNNSSPRLAW